MEEAKTDAVSSNCLSCYCSCGAAIIDYNQYMGSVDLMDQHLSYYSMPARCTLKWWKKIFWRLVDISVVNLWIIFCCNNVKTYSMKLAYQLVQPLLDLRASFDRPKHLCNSKG